MAKVNKNYRSASSNSRHQVDTTHIRGARNTIIILVRASIDGTNGYLILID